MAEQTTTTYHCDKCGQKLKTFDNSLNIVTSLTGEDLSSSYWERLEVKVLHRSGVHNNGKERNADLCQSCAIEILKTAITRIKAGERTTAGSGGNVYQGAWE